MPPQRYSYSKAPRNSPEPAGFPCDSTPEAIDLKKGRAVWLTVLEVVMIIRCFSAGGGAEHHGREGSAHSLGGARKVRREKRRGSLYLVQAKPPGTVLPAMRPHLLNAQHLPVVPEAGDQAFSTWQLWQ